MGSIMAANISDFWPLKGRQIPRIDFYASFTQLHEIAFIFFSLKNDIADFLGMIAPEHLEYFAKKSQQTMKY